LGGGVGLVRLGQGYLRYFVVDELVGKLAWLANLIGQTLLAELVLENSHWAKDNGISARS